MAAVPRKLPTFLHREITRHKRPSGTSGAAKDGASASPASSARSSSMRPMTPRSMALVLRARATPRARISAALRAYYASQTWAALRPATQRMKRHVLNGVDSKLGESKLKDWKRGDIAAGRDKRAATPAAAEMFVKSMRSFFAWALEAGLVSSNPDRWRQGHRVVDGRLRTLDRRRRCSLPRALAARNQTARRLRGSARDWPTAWRRRSHRLPACARRRHQARDREDRRAGSNPRVRRSRSRDRSRAGRAR